MDSNTSVTWSARPVSGTFTAGQVLIAASSTSYVVATAANRASYGRADGVAVYSTPLTGGSALMVSFGRIPASLSGLAAGSVSWVRVSSTGTLERCTPSGSDDIVGKAYANGDVYLSFGFISVAMALVA